MLPEFENAEIVRTRDPNNLGSYDLVLDTGGTFDHVRKRYDHHQKGTIHFVYFTFADAMQTSICVEQM